MTNSTGKLFQDVNSRKILSFSYDLNKDYYTLIREAQTKGYSQSIITSDIMIKLIEHFITEHKSIVTSIEFFVNDSDLELEIKALLNKMCKNSAYWGVLKNKLEFLTSTISIDIKKIDIKCIDTSCLLSIYVNGVFTVTSTAYNDVSKEIASFMEKCVK